MCLQSAWRRILEYPFRIFTKPNSKYEFLFSVNVAVLRHKWWSYFEVLHCVGISFVSSDVLGESIARIFRVVDTEMMRCNKMPHLSTHLNQLSPWKCRQHFPPKRRKEQSTILYGVRTQKTGHHVNKNCRDLTELCVYNRTAVKWGQ
jgi:hypothetical protein